MATARGLKKDLKYLIIYLSLQFLLFLGRILPRTFILFLTSNIGKLAFRLLKKEREKTITNLSIAFDKTKSRDEIYAMAKEVFINQAKNAGDYIATANITTKTGILKYITVEGEEHLKKAFEQKKGVICLVSHVGSWEFSVITLPLLGYPTVAISKALIDKRLNRLIKRLRQKRGLRNLNRGKTYPLLIKALKNNEAMIIMIDQDTKVKSVFVDFFGKPAYTPIGAAKLALESGAPVVPMVMLRTANNKHRFVIQSEISVVYTGNKKNDILINTQNFTKSTEEIVKKYPTQWVWMHRRWKTTPESVLEYEANKLNKN